MLLAWHFNGDKAALKRWCSDTKSNIRNLNATWRRTLTAVMRCRNKAVLAMAAHAMSAHFDVDIPALCVENCMKMHAKGRVLKSDAHGRQKPRMTAGDAEHFNTLISAVENLTTEQRSRMAGSEGKTPTPPRPRSGGCKKKKLTYDELEALNAGLKADREAEVGSCRKADARHDAMVKALNEQRKVARASSADHMLDEMQGRLQGLEFKLALAKEQIAALEEQNAELRAVNALIQNSPDKIKLTMNDGYDRIV